MRLRHYFKPRHAKDIAGTGEEPLYKELAELARGCAREGYVTLVCMHPQPQCICCESKDNPCPMRVPVGGKQVTVLLCEKCQRRISDPLMLSQMIYEVRRGIRSADPGMEMALLFPHGQRIRIVWGYQIESEVLS